MTGEPIKYPDPWLIDSEFLLSELAKLRELILRVPVHNDTVQPAQTAIDSGWSNNCGIFYTYTSKASVHSESEQTKRPIPNPNALRLNNVAATSQKNLSAVACDEMRETTREFVNAIRP